MPAGLYGKETRSTGDEPDGLEEPVSSPKKAVIPMINMLVIKSACNTRLIGDKMQP